MRFFFVLLAALSFVWAGNAQARDMKEATAMTKKPITIEATGGNPVLQWWSSTTNRTPESAAASATTRKEAKGITCPARNVMTRPARIPMTR